MAVVINEFEVLPPAPAAPQSPSPSTGAQDNAGGGKPSTSPRDLQRLLRRESERTRRVRAH